jgi:MtN3 and saliva related transmembrane protein
MEFAPYVGYVAGALTVVSYFPQAVRAWKTKQVKDLSKLMLAMLVAANVLWITYGVVSRSLPIIITNVGTLLLTGAIFVAKLRFGKRGGERRPA